MAGMASDDAPETSRPPTPRSETESDERESSPSSNLFSGDPANNAEPMNLMDAHLMSLQRQERELSANLMGKAARAYARQLSDGGCGSAAGEENEVSSPSTFVPLSEIILPQPPAVDQPGAAGAQADQSVVEAAPAPATAVRICRSCKHRPAARRSVPISHICLCVTCRDNPFASACCVVCAAGRQRSPTDSP